MANTNKALPRVTEDDVRLNCNLARKHLATAEVSMYGDDFTSQQLQAAIDILVRLKAKVDAQIVMDDLSSKEA